MYADVVLGIKAASKTNGDPPRCYPRSQKKTPAEPVFDTDLDAADLQEPGFASIRAEIKEKH